jgi:tripartite-type tricarboxylate transporter receptor subunit TctC
MTTALVALASFSAMALFAQPYPSKPVRVIVPFARGRRTGSRRGGWCWGGDGALPPGLGQYIQRWLAIALVAGAWLAPGASFAQSYPSKPVRVIVPFAPGGGSDILARVLVPKLTEYLGQPFVVDNRGGAGGLIGTEIAARAAPDGYTIITISGSFATNAVVYKSAYDPATGVAPIVEIGFSPFLVAINPSVPARSLKEFMAYARQNTGKLTYGTGGTGSITHLATELLASTGGVKLVHVPYKASAIALTNMVGGQIHLVVGSMLPTLPHVKAGRLIGLAVTTAERWPTNPEIPTVAETFPGYDVELWFGMWAPKGTPAAIVLRLNAAANKALLDSDVEQNLRGSGLRISGGTPQRFAERVRKDTARWNKVVREAGIKVEG